MSDPIHIEIVTRNICSQFFLSELCLIYYKSVLTDILLARFLLYLILDKMLFLLSINSPSPLELFTHFSTDIS